MSYQLANMALSLLYIKFLVQYNNSIWLFPRKLIKRYPELQIEILRKYYALRWDYLCLLPQKI